MGRIIYIIWTSLLFLTPFILWVLPVDAINRSTVNTCPSVVFLGMECLGCGITRAVINFHHFQFDEAIFYNFMVVIVYPFLVFCWLLFVKELLFELAPSKAQIIPFKTFREFDFLKNISKKLFG